jgi:hypothetical protein
LNWRREPGSVGERLGPANRQPGRRERATEGSFQVIIVGFCLLEIHEHLLQTLENG